MIAINSNTITAMFPKITKQRLLLFIKLLLAIAAIVAGGFYDDEVGKALFVDYEGATFFSYHIDLAFGPSVILAAVWISFFWARVSAFWLFIAGAWCVMQHVVTIHNYWVWMPFWGPIMIIFGCVCLGISLWEEKSSDIGLKALFISLFCALFSHFSPHFILILDEKDEVIFALTLVLAGAVLPLIIENPSRKTVLSISAFSVAVSLLNTWSFFIPFFIPFPLFPFVGFMITRKLLAMRNAR